MWFKRVTSFFVLFLIILVITISLDCISASSSNEDMTNHEGRTITWDTNQTISKDYVVEKNETLIIELGIVVNATNGSGIIVNGELRAVGNKSSFVQFDVSSLKVIGGVVCFSYSRISVSTTAYMYNSTINFSDSSLSMSMRVRNSTINSSNISLSTNMDITYSTMNISNSHLSGDKIWGYVSYFNIHDCEFDGLTDFSFVGCTNNFQNLTLDRISCIGLYGGSSKITNARIFGYSHPFDEYKTILRIQSASCILRDTTVVILFPEKDFISCYHSYLEVFNFTLTATNNTKSFFSQSTLILKNSTYYGKFLVTSSDIYVYNTSFDKSNVSFEGYGGYFSKVVVDGVTIQKEKDAIYYYFTLFKYMPEILLLLILITCFLLFSPKIKKVLPRINYTPMLRGFGPTLSILAILLIIYNILFVPEVYMASKPVDIIDTYDVYALYLSISATPFIFETFGMIGSILSPIYNKKEIDIKIFYLCVVLLLVFLLITLYVASSILPQSPKY